MTDALSGIVAACRAVLHSRLDGITNHRRRRQAVSWALLCLFALGFEAPPALAAVDSQAQGASTVTVYVGPVFPYGQHTNALAVVEGTGVPSGTVTFVDSLGGTQCASVPLVNGSALCALATIWPTQVFLSITAQYSGDANNLSSSGSGTFVVDRAPTSPTITASPNPSTLGQIVTLSVNLPSDATGSFEFTADGMNTFFCLGTIVAGQGTCTTTAFAAGFHAVGVHYEGDSHYWFSTSSPVLLEVRPVPTTTSLISSKNPSVVGDALTFTANVAGLSPTGSVAFVDGPTTLCTSTLASGQATCATSALAAGLHTIHATYAGDAEDAASTSTDLQQQVFLPTTTTLATPCSTRFVEGQPFTVGASVSGSSPTGSVTFSDGVSVLCSGAALSQGVAVCTTSAMATDPGHAADTYLIGATYDGDASHAASMSTTLAVTVLSASEVILRNGFDAPVEDCPRQ